MSTRKDQLLRRAAGKKGRNVALTREEKALRAFLEKAGGADWNASEGEPGHVKNRTHYEETTVVNEPLNITWDGNTEGLVSVVSEWGTSFHKISNAIPTLEQLEKGFSFIAKYYESNPYNEKGVSNWSEVIDVALFLQKDEIGFAVAYKDGATAGRVTFPEKGLYFTVSHAYEEPAYILSFTTTEPVPQTKTVIKKLDKKFLPDTEIIFTGAINAEGWPDFTCNAPYEEARAKVEQGCTARVVLCNYSNTYPVFTHFPCVEVRLSSRKVTFEFMDLGRGDSMYLAYDENGNIGNGEE